MKRVHGDTGSTAGSPPQTSSASTGKGRKRKTDTSPAATASNTRRASLKAVQSAEATPVSSKPLLEIWLDERDAVEKILQDLRAPDDVDSLQRLTEVQRRLEIMTKMVTELRPGSVDPEVDAEAEVDGEDSDTG